MKFYAFDLQHYSKNNKIPLIYTTDSPQFTDSEIMMPVGLAVGNPKTKLENMLFVGDKQNVLRFRGEVIFLIFWIRILFSLCLGASLNSRNSFQASLVETSNRA